MVFIKRLKIIHRPCSLISSGWIVPKSRGPDRKVPLCLSLLHRLWNNKKGPKRGFQAVGWLMLDQQLPDLNGALKWPVTFWKSILKQSCNQWREASHPSRYRSGLNLDIDPMLDEGEVRIKRYRTFLAGRFLFSRQGTKTDRMGWTLRFLFLNCEKKLGSSISSLPWGS